MDLSLVIPCYNEAPHLAGSVKALREVLDGTRYDYEIVFVDDGSRDGTRDLLREICAQAPRCRYILHEQNRGRGAAFKTGFEATSGRITGFLDIDLEVGAHYIPPLVHLIEHHGVDIATGYRHYLLRQTLALHRIVLSWVYRMLLGLLIVGRVVKDSETGCKFFRRESTQAVVLGSEDDGWFWDTEVMMRAVLADLCIHEMPVLFLRRWDKQSTVRLGSDILAYLRALHRFRRRVGLSLLHKSPIYWSAPLYDRLIQLLFGRRHEQAYVDVAQQIPEGSSVVDLCSGTGKMYRDHLRSRGCRYLGLDFNGHFVMRARRSGVPTQFFNVLSDTIPPADYIVMMSSLYHFRRRAGDVLERMKAAARRAVIISEPVDNLSHHDSFLGRLAPHFTNPGVGEYDHRYSIAELRALTSAHGATAFIHHPGDRNAIAVFRRDPS